MKNLVTTLSVLLILISPKVSSDPLDLLYNALDSEDFACVKNHKYGDSYTKLSIDIGENEGSFKLTQYYDTDHAASPFISTKTYNADRVQCYGEVEKASDETSYCLINGTLTESEIGFLNSGLDKRTEARGFAEVSVHYHEKFGISAHLKSVKLMKIGDMIESSTKPQKLLVFSEKDNNGLSEIASEEFSITDENSTCTM